MPCFTSSAMPITWQLSKMCAPPNSAVCLAGSLMWHKSVVQCHVICLLLTYWLMPVLEGSERAGG